MSNAAVRQQERVLSDVRARFIQALKRTSELTPVLLKALNSAPWYVRLWMAAKLAVGCL